MINAQELIKATEVKLLKQCHRTFETATSVQLHNAISDAIMDAIAPTWVNCQKARAGKRHAVITGRAFPVGFCSLDPDSGSFPGKRLAGISPV